MIAATSSWLQTEYFFLIDSMGPLCLEEIIDAISIKSPNS